MTPEAYGLAELTNNISELLYPLATLCVYDAAFRFAVDPDYENKKIATATFLVLLKSLALGAVIFSLVFIVFNYEHSFYLLFILYTYSFRMTAAYYTRGKGLTKIFAISGVINAVALAAFNALFLVAYNFGVGGYLLSIGLANVVSTFYLLIYANIRLDISPKTNVRKETRVLLAYSVPLILYNVLYWFTTIGGRYVLLWFTDESTVGLYVAAIKIAAIINMIQQAVYAAFQLTSSRSFNKSNKEQLYSAINNLMTSAYFIFGAMAIMLAPALGALTLRGPFSSASVFLPLILLGAIVGCLSSLYGTMYSTYKKTKRMVPASILGAAINVALSVLLAPIWGIWGICLATLLCNLAQVIYKVIDIKSFCPLRYDWINITFNSCAITIETILVGMQNTPSYLGAVAIFFLMVFVNAFKYRDQLGTLVRKLTKT